MNETIDTYGRDIGPSPIVANGRIIQLGPRPGALDAHVRRGYLLLRCEAGAGYGNDRPIEMTFNDEDAAILRKVADVVLGRFWRVADAEDARDVPDPVRASAGGDAGEQGRPHFVTGMQHDNGGGA